MNGAHDMGGRMGFGPVQAEPHEPVFHARWEARFFALASLLDGGWTLDEDRHTCENRPPAEYLKNSYYETWLKALETLARDRGIFDRTADAGTAMTAEAVLPAVQARGSYQREAGAAARFAVGDQVRVRNLHTAGHTRLPGYLRGAVGRIVTHHGAHVFPDCNAHGHGENPHYLYTVRFRSSDVFGLANADTIHADMWEPYLEAV